jgi:hypothetical protein
MMFTKNFPTLTLLTFKSLEVAIHFYILPTQFTYVFCMDIRTNGDYSPIQNKLNFYNLDAVFTARYELNL